METLKIIQQYDAMTTITLVASLVTIFVFILLILLWNRYEKCRSERNSARFTIERLKDDLKFLHKKHDDQERVLRDAQSRLDKLTNRVEVIGIILPPKGADESDRQYEQRCRMKVTNKAYDYVLFGEGACSLAVLKQ